MGARHSKVTVLLNTEEFARLDQFCELRGFKKSTLISMLIREHLDREAFPGQSLLALGDEGLPRHRTVKGRSK